MTVTLGDFSVEQSFIVVENLSTPVILGCDYLTDNGFVLHFKLGTCHRAETPNQKLKLLPAEAIPCHLITVDDDCPQAIPTRCQDHSPADMPSDVHPNLIPVLDLKPSSHNKLVKLMLLSTQLTQEMLCLSKFLPGKFHSIMQTRCMLSWTTW